MSVFNLLSKIRFVPLKNVDRQLVHHNQLHKEKASPLTTDKSTSRSGPGRHSKIDWSDFLLLHDWLYTDNKIRAQAPSLLAVLMRTVQQALYVSFRFVRLLIYNDQSDLAAILTDRYALDRNNRDKNYTGERKCCVPVVFSKKCVAIFEWWRVRLDASSTG